MWLLIILFVMFGIFIILTGLVIDLPQRTKSDNSLGHEWILFCCFFSLYACLIIFAVGFLNYGPPFNRCGMIVIVAFPVSKLCIRLMRILEIETKIKAILRLN